MAFRFEQLTLKSQEAVQQRPIAGPRPGTPTDRADAPAGGALDADQQVVRSLLTQLGVNPAQIFKAAEEGLNALPKVSGGETDHQPGAEPGSRNRSDRGRADERSVCLGRALAAGSLKVKSRAKTLLEALGIVEKDVLQALQKVRGGQSVTDQSPEDKYQALEAYGRDLVELAEGQDGPGHRP